ncbi:hypothetical protein R1flu_028813 [Riccia fluitans]|uniref:Uncharacterized protein n=1 Tax=Riccia fluitans TaxID=41844 RepID=A0ABD1XNB4_9MARC
MSLNRITVSRDEIRSLEGCRPEAFRFEFGTRLDPSSITFCVNREVDPRRGKANIVIFDRYGWQYVDGIEESFESTMTFLRKEVLLRKKMEIADIQIMDVQAIAEREGIPLDDPDTPLWKIKYKAFIQITLKWGEHRVVFGNLLNTLHGTICISGV